MHDCQLVRGELVLILVLGHLPPAAGAAELSLGFVLILGRAAIIEMRGVALHTELSMESIISVVLVVLHAGDNPPVRGSEGSQRGQVRGGVAGVRVAVSCRENVVLGIIILAIRIDWWPVIQPPERVVE